MLTIFVLTILAAVLSGCPLKKGDCERKYRPIVGGSLPSLVHADEEFGKVLEYYFSSTQVDEAILARMCRAVLYMSPVEAEEAAQQYLRVLIGKGKIPSRLKEILPDLRKTSSRKLESKLGELGREIYYECRALRSKRWL
jgi:hypothetical protein